MSTLCAPCETVKKLPVCFDELTIGNYGAVLGVDVFVYVNNLTTGRRQVFEVVTGSLGVVVIENFAPIADHLYEIHINEDESTPDIQETFTIGDTETVCVHARFYRVFETGANLEAFAEVSFSV